MTYVVREACIKCKYTDCVEICPADCFYEGPNFLVINPDECIDCALCIPECPVDAIVEEDDLSKEDHKYLELNAKLSKKWPNIIARKNPAEDAADWADVKDKLKYLEDADEELKQLARIFHHPA